MHKVGIVLTPNPFVIELCVGILNTSRDDDRIRRELMSVAGVLSVESGEDSLIVHLSQLADYNDGWLLQRLVNAVCLALKWVEVQEELLIWQDERGAQVQPEGKCTRIRLSPRAVTALKED